MPIKLPSFRPRRDAYPPDLWTKCPSCGEMLFNKQLDKVLRVCPSCGHHFRLSASARLEMLVDNGSFAEHDAGLESEDPLGFTDQKSYPDRVAAAQLATGMRDAAVWGTATLDGTTIAICVMDFGFMGGSMGAVVGEKVTRAAEHALAARIPLLVVSASGGARMQEGTLSLMQLAKTVAAIERLRGAGVPFLSLLSDPTTGGVFASFAVLGDVNLAEPNALIGFAGARVSAGTIASELPPGFQRSEFLFAHGFLDRVIHRSEMRTEIATLLRFLVARPVPPPLDGPDGDPLGLPSFRPLSFLSNLAERVLPAEPDEVGPPSNGHRVTGPAATARIVPIATEPAIATELPIATEPPIDTEPAIATEVASAAEPDSPVEPRATEPGTGATESELGSSEPAPIAALDDPSEPAPVEENRRG
jgi:acetyl-CoA carboxylase carboxyl transferase subunit beta